MTCAHGYKLLELAWQIRQICAYTLFTNNVYKMQIHRIDERGVVVPFSIRTNGFKITLYANRLAATKHADRTDKNRILNFILCDQNITHISSFHRRFFSVRIQVSIYFRCYEKIDKIKTTNFC